MKTTFFAILIISLNIYIIQAQTPLIDSLENSLKETQNDSLKAYLMGQIAWKLRGVDLKRSFEYGNKSIQLIETHQYQQIKAQVYNYLGVIYRNLHDYSNALKYYYKALKAAQQNNQDIQVAYAYNNIGQIFKYQKRLKDAEKNTKTAASIFIKIGNKTGEAYACLRLGEILQKQKKYKGAFQHLNKAITIREKFSNQAGLDAALNKAGELFIEQKKYPQALEYLQQALKQSLKGKTAGSRYDIQNNIAYVYLQQQKPQKVIELASQTYQEAATIPSRGLMQQSLALLHQAYLQKKEYQIAYRYQADYIKITEDFLDEKIDFRINALESIYQLEKKQTEIYLKNKDIELLKKEQKAHKLRQSLVYALIAGIVFLLGFVFVLTRNNRIKQRTNYLLQAKNREINEKSVAISEQNDELQSQQEEIKQQRDAIDLQNRHIKQGIKAAQRIQTTILPNDEQVCKLLNNHFIIYKPLDIVSGDFYWVGQVKDLRIIAVIDCTGHGVQGALMSMIGYTLLNEIIINKYITDPIKILNSLRSGVKEVLKQEKKIHREGMDVALVTLQNLDEQNTLVEFVGAKRPLWYLTDNDSEMQVIRGDRISIGISYNENRKFTSQKILCPKGSMIYMFTDGLPDQNNPARVKLGSHTLTNLLIKNRHLTCSEQQKLLEQALITHMDGVEQRDDILFIGFEV